ncbi:MAG: site-specific DNA-methyltransferase [Nitrospinae bacterium]|nr:site-specific DNA-methyltransferase [Nitrospinota bacterium]
MARGKSGSRTPVESLKHQDKRANIPTEELRDFVADDEKSPKTLLYPRDPSLDPQLVWKDKDDQDQHPLEVPAVPIYIQEKIHPQAIIEDLRAQSKRTRPESQLELFADFNGINFEDLVDFYRHEQNWSNRMILGDSLLVMTSLAEKEGLKGKVQMIYLDPPYGIKFGSNWQVSTRKRDVKDGKPEDLTRQPEQIKAFRDTWKLGIHSYLSYLRDRLVVARELLTESGSIFVQIGDENVHLVRCLLDEVFGSENFCGIVMYQKTGGFSPTLLALNVDFILWYAKDRSQVKYHQLFEATQVTTEETAFLDFIELSDGSRRPLSQQERQYPERIPAGLRLLSRNPLTSDGYIESLAKPFEFQGQVYKPQPNSHWKTTSEGMQNLRRACRLIVKGNTLRFVRYLGDFPVKARGCLWTDTGTGGFVGDEKVYVVQTDTRAIERCILMTTDPGDLVFDPTCGSGTTAYVAEQWGRRWITCDTSRVALALARTRLMAAKYPYYLLADSPEGIKKEMELTGTLTPALSQRERGKPEGNIKKGFVYKRVPHVTLKSIANNPEIDNIHARWQEKLKPLRAELNQLLKQSWEEWQIPREAGEAWPQTARDLLSQWWQLRRERQKETDASIARHADTEILYDQPYEDSKRIRVTGPFTVESLSPHRVLSTDGERPVSEREAQQEATAGQFEAMILENLKKAGVQNTVKSERLLFERLETYAGEWLHAAGEYPDRNGIPRRFDRMISLSSLLDLEKKLPGILRTRVTMQRSGSYFATIFGCSMNETQTM